jgi:hypothetical protein
MLDTIHNILDRNAVCNDCYTTMKKVKREKERNEMKSNILEHVLGIDICVSRNEIKSTVASQMQISENLCDTLLSEIPDESHLLRPFDIVSYLSCVPTEKCTDCNCKLIKLKENSIRIWKNMPYCDVCWSKFHNERERMWQNILEKYTHCAICNVARECSGHRFHFDHMNMFQKEESICTMVNEGRDLKDIKSELARCQYICLSCHHIITDIERKFPFTKVKRNLTVKLHNLEITEEQYHQECCLWQSRYEEHMKGLYDILAKTC